MPIVGGQHFMREYWVKNTADAEADGPINAAELRRRVASLELSRDALVSVDQSLWYRAERMKGLTFPAEEGAGHVTLETAPAPKTRRPVHRSIPPSYPGAMAMQSSSTAFAPVEPAHMSVPVEGLPTDASSAGTEPHPIEATPFHESIEPPLEAPPSSETQGWSPLEDELSAEVAAAPVAPVAHADLIPKRQRPATPIDAFEEPTARPRGKFVVLVLAIAMLVALAAIAAWYFWFVRHRIH
jgi:hypothetical protein